MKLLLILATCVALSQGRTTTDSKIEAGLLRSMTQGETANIFVTFNEGTDQVLQAITDTRFDTRPDLLWAIHDNLNSLAERVQAGVLNSFVEGRFSYKSLWISNQMYIKNATMSLVLQLASHPDVKELTEEIIIELDTIVEGPVIRGRQNQEEWGVRMIQAPEARSFLNQSTKAAAPVVACTIDTGVRYTHEALRDNWVGEYGWYDPYDLNANPVDNNGHGTHTTGTICGKGGIGVYPDAKWMACRGCATSSCSQFALLDCAQFTACPTLADGTKPDCSKAPNVVSNSWGGGRGQTWFDSAIAALHAAKVIPFFSIGNSGPSCNTANSPGDREVIGVGSTTDQDALSSFSSVGPTIDGRMKPDISAPGSNVLSSVNTADNAYASYSGTSMACPHAAGMAVMAMALDPTLEYKTMANAIRAGVDTEKLVSSGKVCDGHADNEFPNHHYGQGRINALKTLQGLSAKKV